MYLVLGATGNIGARVVKGLRALNAKVIAIAHSNEKASQITDGNVEGVAVDVSDTEALRRVFRLATRAFLLNPPAPPTSDTDTEETRSAASIASALLGSGLEKIVVASTYGARIGRGIGDLSVLFELEHRVEASGVPAAINRGAYYFTNFDTMIETAKGGSLPTPFPEDLVIPMVSPVDLAKAAVERLLGPVEDVGVQFVEGPARLTMRDVASIMTEVIGRNVALQNIPRSEIEKSFLDLGFSEPAAKAYAAMTRATIDDPDPPREFRRGTVTLEDHLRALI